MINTIWGTTVKPEASRQLATTLEAIPGLEGTLYVGYPIIGTPEGAFPLDALLLSPTKGLIVFHLIEGKSFDTYEVILDEIYRKLQSKLLNYSSLSKKRQLRVEITTIVFAPALSAPIPPGNDTYIVASLSSLSAMVNAVTWADTDLFPQLASVVQAISTIRKGRKRRETKKDDSFGARMRKVDDSIANLDSQQSAAVIETVEGIQRLRGLAGSGKTIVLALKVAYLHARHPEWRIAVTFNTRSLKGQFERLINSFVIEQTNEEPDWDNIEIVNAWGAPGNKAREGIYSKFCVANDLQYLDYKTAELQFGSAKSFAGVCDLALSQLKSSKQLYDAILVDEAQDFAPSFLRLCYQFLKPPKRLVYAYDELQNLTGDSLPPPEELFGLDSQGQPRVSFTAPLAGRPRQDIILEKCYRNSRPLLSTAHALGFGIYRDPGGLIQLFEQKELWRDVGYSVSAGSLSDGAFVSLERTENTSPRFLESHSDIDTLIQFKTFDSDEEQLAWLVANIRRNVSEDELDPEDVLVINPDPLKTRNAVAKPRAELLRHGINSTLAGVSSSADVFFEPNTVTFTGIYRAKGNEAAMVYVINAQDCYSSFIPADLSKARNRLFTAITRSKAWVRVLGVGPNMDKLRSEYQRVSTHGFKLDFVYPNEEARKKLQIVNRDMTKADRERLKKGIGDAASFIEALDRGEIEMEDLPSDILDKLKRKFATETGTK